VVVELEADEPPEIKKALATVTAITIVNARSTYVLIEEPCFSRLQTNRCIPYPLLLAQS
jgi:hypothetical protein